MKSLRVKRMNNFFSVIYKLLRNLHFKISKFFENCLIKYLLFDRIRTGGMHKEEGAFLKTEALIYRGYNPFLSSMEGDKKLMGTTIGFLNVGTQMDETWYS